MANLLQYDPIAYGYIDPNAAPPPPPEDPNLLYNNPLSAPSGMDKYSAPGYMPVNGEGGYTSQGDYAPAPAPAGPPPDQGYQAQLAGSGAPADYGVSTPPPDQGYQAQVAGSGGYQEPVPPPAPLTFDQGPDARADVNVIGQPQSTMGVGSAPAGGTFAPQPTAPLPMVNDRSSMLGQNTRPFPASADQSYGQVERNRSGIDYPQSAPSLMTHTKPPQRGGYSVSGRSGYKAPQPNTPQLPPKDPFQILQDATSAVGSGVYDAVASALNAVTPGASAAGPATSQRGNSSYGGGGGGGAPINANFTVGPGRPATGPTTPTYNPISTAPIPPPGGGGGLDIGAGLGLLGGALAGSGVADTVRGAMGKQRGPGRQITSSPRTPTALPRFEGSNAGRQQIEAAAHKDPFDLLGSFLSEGGGNFKDYAVDSIGSVKTALTGGKPGPFLNAVADNAGSTIQGQNEALMRDSGPIQSFPDNRLYNGNRAAPVSKSSLPMAASKMEVWRRELEDGDVIDANGNWKKSALQRFSDEDYIDANGNWTEKARSIVRDDRIGKPAQWTDYKKFQLGESSNAPSETGGSTEQAATPPVTNGPVTNSDIASNTSTDGGSDWVDYGSSKKSSGWRDYGSSSGGGGSSGRSSRSSGGSSGGFSSRWQDYAEDSDGDGQFSPAEIKAAKKKMKMAMMKRGKMGRGKKGSMIQRPTSPIRKTTLANLSTAFGRPVGGWPEGL